MNDNQMKSLKKTVVVEKINSSFNDKIMRSSRSLAQVNPFVYDSAEHYFPVIEQNKLTGSIIKTKANHL